MMKLIKSYIEFFFPRFYLGGAEGLILSAALSGVGALMQQQSANDAAKKQERIIRQTQAEEDRLSKQRQGMITDFAGETFDPNARNEAYEQGAAENEQKLVEGVTAARPEGADQVKKAAAGNLSEDYLQALGNRTSDSMGEMLKRARSMSRSNAGGLMYGNEAMRLGDLNSRVGEVDLLGRMNSRVGQSRLGSVRNRGSLAGGLLTAVAPFAGNAIDPMMNMFGGGGNPAYNRFPSISTMG
jgi:hypothetical protein